MTETLVVTTTLENREDAENMARHLLQKRLIACAQLSSPVESFYWWKNSIEQQQEFQLVMKSTQVLWDELRDEIEKMHPYDIPEIIATPVSAVSNKYNDWLNEELKR